MNPHVEHDLGSKSMQVWSTMTTLTHANEPIVIMIHLILQFGHKLLWMTCMIILLQVPSILPSLLDDAIVWSRPLERDNYVDFGFLLKVCHC
jgi:hypothetical protein